MTPLRTAALLVLVGLALTGCGGGSPAAQPAETITAVSETPTETPTPTPTPTLREFQADGGYYVDVYDLREAVVLGGGDVCEDWEYWGFVAFADGTISCDG